MLVILALFACTSTTPETEPAPEPAPVAAPAPEPAAPEFVSLTAAEMAEKLGQPSDKPRVVNFWATWCGPCVEELPRLRAWGEEHHEVDLSFVNVDLHILQKKKVIPFAEKHGITDFPNFQVSDKDPAMALAGALPEFQGAIPFTFVIAPDGTRKVLQGSVQTADIDAALGEP